jgi:hypothetical protein
VRERERERERESTGQVAVEENYNKLKYAIP